MTTLQVYYTPLARIEWTVEDDGSFTLIPTVHVEWGDSYESLFCGNDELSNNNGGTVSVPTAPELAIFHERLGQTLCDAPSDLGYSLPTTVRMPTFR